jgi:hypothetical protein
VLEEQLTAWNLPAGQPRNPLIAFIATQDPTPKERAALKRKLRAMRLP